MGNGSVTAVPDTGPIIHLDEIDALGCLDVLDRIYVPRTVIEELEEGGMPDEFRTLEHEIIEVETSEAYDSLDEGEAAALSLLESLDGVLLTDDLDARDRAKENGIEVHGTVGILALAANLGEMTTEEAAQKMRLLQSETSLFVTEAVVERGIRLLDEE